MSLGLYIHIPFCARKCEYCDFVSFAERGTMIEPYLDALEREMAEYAAARGVTEVDTVFIGGGTPSLLRAEDIKRLCAAVGRFFRPSAGCEWTMEANPGTLSRAKLTAALEGGVNRLSIGVQSFNDTELKAVGRIHRAAEAARTVTEAAALGFDNISIDLMASLPYQTEDSFARSLSSAVTLPIKHISVYSLIIEEGTPLWQKYADGTYAEPDEEADRRMYRFTREFLARHGFERYEVSNYAVPGFESRHNLRYWECSEYIGVGLAAHSYLDGVRCRNTDDLSEYIAGNYRAGEPEILTVRDMESEFMILGLRKTAGVSEREFARRFGRPVADAFGDVLDKYTALGLLEKADGMYRFTERGTDIENTVLCEFL